MALDPFLLNHFINPRTFSVGGLLSPIAIRDQIIRGQKIVDRAFEEELIKKGSTSPFLVVGAGVSGVTAAIRAIRHGVPTQVIDMREQPFSVQKGCMSRWICPTQYDWPVDHYNQGRFPFDNSIPRGETLCWRADRADRLADGWEFQFYDAQDRYSRLIDVKWRTALTDHDPTLDSSEEFVSVTTRLVTGLHPDGTPTLDAKPISFLAQAVLLSFGFGRERNYLVQSTDTKRPARGLPFWQNDPIALSNLGVQGGLAHVLITGSGDGALQDFLRTVIDSQNGGEFYAREIYNSLQISPDLEHDLQSIQDHAQRAHAWGANTSHDHEPLSQLHQEYLQRVVRLLQSQRGPTIRNMILRRLRNPLPEVRLVYDCNHFTNCYGLNRFLSLLISRVLEERDGKPILFPGYRVVDLICDHSPHTCQGKAFNPTNPSDPTACHGWWHRGVVQEYPDCRKDSRVPESWGNTIDDFWEANVLILRNGVERNEKEKRLSPRCARQILPYSIYP